MKKAQALFELIISMLLVISSVLFLLPAMHFQESRLFKANSASRQSVIEAYCNIRFIDGNGFASVMAFDSKASMQGFECLSPKVEKTNRGLVIEGAEPWF